MDHGIERKQRRRFTDGETIFKQGAAASEMYVVYEGKVLIYREHDGHETELARLGPDDFFGEMGLFDGNSRSASARAIGPVEVRVVGADALSMMQCDPVINQLLVTLTERLRSMDEAFEQLSKESDARRTFASSRVKQNYWLT